MAEGPLAGIRIVEMSAIGPVPLCGMLLADMGAEILRIDRPGETAGRDARDFTGRSRRSIELDLKQPAGAAVLRGLLERADALLEGARPGVMERLGLGPDACAAFNPRLVYGRMTGWGQEGPLAPSAGHDINYIALTGALHAIGRAGDRPVPPLNLVGDYGGGAMFLAFGIVCALLEARGSGRGQVVDAAMVDGAATLMAPIRAMFAAGRWADARGVNLLDGGAPWYDTYRTADGKYVAIGALEEKFWRILLTVLGLDKADLPPRTDRAGWPVIRARIADAIGGKSRDQWAALFAGTDACAAPVLTMAEAPAHAQARARAAYVEEGGVVQPAPAPRFSRTPGRARPFEALGPEGAARLLADWGVGAEGMEAAGAAGLLG